MQALLSDELWSVVRPLLPKRRAHPKGGRPAQDDRQCLEGILYVLRGGIPWRLLPKEIGPSPCTCWRRLQHWTKAGVWDKVHHKLLQALAQAKALDTERALIDSASVRAVFGGRTPAPMPPTAAKMAAKGT